MISNYIILSPGSLKSWPLIAALACLLGAASAPAQTESVQMEIISFSPQVARATASFGEYTVEFTTVPGEINGELAIGGFDFDLWSVLVLETPFDFEPSFVDFELNLPFYADVNDNGIEDFYDRAMPVNNVAVQGYFMNPFTDQPSEVNGVWNRPAGSVDGQLSLSFPYFDFTSVHNFVIYIYEGDFTFTRSGQQLSGNVELTSGFDPADVLTGPLSLTIQDPLTLTWGTGTWESAAYFYSFQYDSQEDPFEHIGARYLSFFAIADGYPYSSGQDFIEWMGFLDGTDSDGDGTPDIAEGDAPPVSRPSLEADRAPSGIRITIIGTAGSSYALEGINSIGETWANLQTIVLASTTQTLTLPANAPHQFLRLRLL